MNLHMTDGHWFSRDDFRMFMAEQIRAIGCAQAEITQEQDFGEAAQEISRFPGKGSMVEMSKVQKDLCDVRTCCF